MTLLITNIEHGLTGDAAGTRFSGAIRVRDGVIADMGALTATPEDTVVDAAGCVVTPGLVNTHHHLFQSLLKGVPGGINAGLDVWLQQVPYAFWPHFDPKTLAIAARVGLTELVLTGATTVCDHHYIYARDQTYDATQILFAEAARFGVRFLLARGGNTKGREYFDDPSLPAAFTEPAGTFLDRVRADVARWHDPSPFAMTRMALAPTTPIFNLDPGEVPLFAEAARDFGVRLHSHLSENMTYVHHTTRAYGQRPLPWLADRGWTGPDVWFAHLVELTGDELSLLADTGTAMAHCTQANARLGSGVAPAPRLQALGGCVSLGVDGAGANEAADMGAAMYAAFATHRAVHGAQAVTAETVLHWASAGGARALGFDRVGQLAPGQAADIAIFDITHPRNLGLHDPALAPMITGAATVRHSWAAGRPLVENGRIPWLDLDRLRDDAQRATAHLMERRRAALG